MIRNVSCFFQQPIEAFLFLQKFLITKNAERFIKVSHLSKHTLKGDVRLVIIHTVFSIPPPSCPLESPVTSVLCPEPFSLSVLMNIWAQVDNPVTSPPTLLSNSNIPFWLENKTSLSHIDCHLKVMNRVSRSQLEKFYFVLGLHEKESQVWKWKGTKVLRWENLCFENIKMFKAFLIKIFLR